MAVTGLGDSPLKSSWIGRLASFYAVPSFTNKGNNDPVYLVIRDYFFEAAAAGVTSKYRSTMQSLENGFVSARNYAFQPSEDGAIA